MVKKYRFIVNPTAGQGAGSQAIPEIRRLAKEYQFDYDLVSTERRGHAIDLAREAAVEGIGYVVSVGGDGTSNEVLNGLMQAWSRNFRETVMGIIGVGRGNDFAYGFGIPAGIEAGFKTIQQDHPCAMDVGFVVGGDYPNGRYFGNGVGIGFDAVVGFEAAKLTHLHGFMNYIVAALRTIFLFFHAPNLRIEYDENIITQPSLMVSIMNGRRMGGGFMMAPKALTNDGFLDLCIAGQTSRIGILGLIPRFMKGTQATHPKIKTGNARKVHVVALSGVLPTHADGETICVAGKELTIDIINQPIKIYCGQIDA